jgi:hypothetical protein
MPGILVDCRRPDATFPSNTGTMQAGFRELADIAMTH